MFNRRRKILDSVERALIDAISPQVLAIYASIGFGPAVQVQIFVDGVLPEAERALISLAVEEIVVGPPRVADVQIHVIDRARLPIAGRGTCLFRRRSSRDN